nr:hypothetical protein [Phytohabitans suffuscus]
MKSASPAATAVAASVLPSIGMTFAFQLPAFMRRLVAMSSRLPEAAAYRRVLGAALAASTISW